MYVNYDIDETTVLKSWTGPLRPSGVILARDLARSRSVWILKGSDATEEVTITAVDVKHSSADNEIADFTFTWRRSALDPNRSYTVRPPKLFDDTFDETYD